MVTAIRALTAMQHTLFGVLTAVCVTRAWSSGAPRAALVVAVLAFAGWYAVGVQRSRQSVSGRHPGEGPTVGGDGATPTATTRPQPYAAASQWWMVGLLAGWVALVLVSAENVWLAFSLWLLIPHFFRLRWALAVSLGVLALVVWRPWAATGELTLAAVLGPAVGALFAVALARGQYQLVRDGLERQQLVESLVRAQHETAVLHDELAAVQREAGASEERTRLSRDIHDTLAQGFSSILLLARGRSVIEGDAALADLLAQIESTAGANLAEARSVVSALAPPLLSENGLTQALHRLLDTLADETGIRTDLRVEGDLERLPTPVEVALLRTAQGALANVRVHSQATRVVVTLSGLERTVRLDVVDDGRGFVPDALEGRAGVYSQGGYGLPSTKARLRELGGDLELESAPAEGTALSAHLPLGEAYRR
ncbi:sensor histidine kinase [Lapillicoccus sp.]|uniref:sensor histidine kinase n=1 Tax=Lapillicoccus sp. TaxID=1909287 RepID=UPI003264676C